MAAALSGFFEKTGTAIGDYDRVAFYGPDARSHGGALKAAGVAAEAVQSPLFGRLGNAGAAFAPLQLVAALEAAAPGQKILLANFGNGADVTAFSTAAPIEKLAPRRGVEWNLARRRVVSSYDDFVKAKGLAASEWDAGTNPGLSATILFRERDDDLSLLGQQCNDCGAIQFPAQRICESCFSKDSFTQVRLSDRIGKVVTYTFDFFFPTPNPPDGSDGDRRRRARIHLQVVEIAPEDMKIGLEVEFVFRRIHESGGRPNYYWKGIPKPE